MKCGLRAWPPRDFSRSARNAKCRLRGDHESCGTKSAIVISTGGRNPDRIDYQAWSDLQRSPCTPAVHTTSSAVSANSFFASSHTNAAARTNLPERIDITTCAVSG